MAIPLHIKIWSILAIRVMIIGVDCGATFIKAGLVAKKRIIKKIVVPTQAQKGKAVSMRNILNAINKLYRPQVNSIGIGFPAPVDTAKGLIRETNNMPGWRNVFLKKIVEQKFRLPCYIDNDAKCFTLAEFRYGAGKHTKNMIGITLGTGVGMGIIINRQLYSGNTGVAGEISKIPYHGHHLENIANIHFFKTIAKIEPTALYEKLKHHQKTANKIINQYGTNLGIIITFAVDILDPELIVLGGGLSHLFPYFKKPMFTELKKNTYTVTYKKIKILPSQLKDVAILGAASLCNYHG